MNTATDVLGELKRRYAREMARHHPDRGGNPEAFRRVVAERERALQDLLLRGAWRFDPGEEFRDDETTWRVSQRGNVWTSVSGWHVVVFRSKKGEGWGIGVTPPGKEKATWGKGLYEDRETAQRSALAFLAQMQEVAKQ